MSSTQLDEAPVKSSVVPPREDSRSHESAPAEERSRGQIESAPPTAMTPASAPSASRTTFLDRWLARRVLSLVRGLPIEVALWDGEVLSASNDPVRSRVTIQSRSTLLSLLFDPSMAFGDGYSRGEITVSGDLVRFFEHLAQANRQAPHWFDNYRWRWWHWLSPNTRAASKNHIHQHYDLGNEFYRLWLDEQMAYTCAYFSEPTLELAAAQRAKFDHVARKLRLKPGDRVVEAGCGWGGLAMHLAREYGVSVQAYNISHEQVAFARDRAKSAGLEDRVVFVEDDWRSIDGQFDAFVSVGMLEHVGPENFRELGDVIHRSLKPGGLALLHTIGRNLARPIDLWTEKRIFPGGCPPSLRQMMDIFETRDFSILDVENLRLHYARTLECWRDNFELHTAEVERMFDANFVRMWRLYLNASIANFRTGWMQLFQVVFCQGQNNAVPWTRADLYEEPHHARTI
ncbi:MAG: cyclopropane-fatty-acyl-phospholipid synthase family protein [Planctomycetota bacterium]